MGRDVEVDEAHWASRVHRDFLQGFFFGFFSQVQDDFPQTPTNDNVEK